MIAPYVVTVKIRSCNLGICFLIGRCCYEWNVYLSTGLTLDKSSFMQNRIEFTDRRSSTGGRGLILGPLSQQAMFLVAKKQKKSERTVHPFPLVGETSPNLFDNFFKIGCAPGGAFQKFLPLRKCYVNIELKLNLFSICKEGKI